MLPGMDPCDETPSETQADWQQIARRLRMQVERAIACIEGQLAHAADNDAASAEVLNNVATAALSAFALERQAASLDTAIRRESAGW